jgi:hypothetical protein
MPKVHSHDDDLRPPAPTINATEHIAAETAEIELERLQKKISREERKKRREIEQTKQKKATWLLPSLLLATMVIAWILSQLRAP